MSSSLIGAVIGGIIATSIGIYLHYFVGDRKLKKRICGAFYEELHSNHTHLKEAAKVPWTRTSLPYTVLFSSYPEARSCGIFTELPIKVRASIERLYIYTEFLNSYKFRTLKSGSALDTEVLDILVKSMDEALPQLKEICSNLRVFPHDDVAYVARKIKRAVLRRGHPKT